MPSPLDNAISQLQEEVDSYGQGSAKQPPDGTSEWYLLRAATLGLAYLKRLSSLDLAGDAGACERIYLKGSLQLKNAPKEIPGPQIPAAGHSPGQVAPGSV